MSASGPGWHLAAPLWHLRPRKRSGLSLPKIPSSLTSQPRSLASSMLTSQPPSLASPCHRARFPNILISQPPSSASSMLTSQPPSLASPYHRARFPNLRVWLRRVWLHRLPNLCFGPHHKLRVVLPVWHLRLTSQPPSLASSLTSQLRVWLHRG